MLLLLKICAILALGVKFDRWLMRYYIILIQNMNSSKKFLKTLEIRYKDYDIRKPFAKVYKFFVCLRIC